MPVEEIGIGIARVVLHFLFEILFMAVFYKTGWAILKLVTLGRYPPQSPQKYNDGFVIAVGIVFYVVIAILAVKIFTSW